MPPPGVKLTFSGVPQDSHSHQIRASSRFSSKFDFIPCSDCAVAITACCILVRSDLGSQFFSSAGKTSKKHIWRICVSTDYVQLNPGSSWPDKSTWQLILVNSNSNWFVDYISSAFVSAIRSSSQLLAEFLKSRKWGPLCSPIQPTSTSNPTSIRFDTAEINLNRQLNHPRIRCDIYVELNRYLIRHGKNVTAKLGLTKDVRTKSWFSKPFSPSFQVQNWRNGEEFN